MWIPKFTVWVLGLQKGKHFHLLNHFAGPMASLPTSWLHGKNRDFFGHFVVKFLLKKSVKAFSKKFKAQRWWDKLAVP